MNNDNDEKRNLNFFVCIKKNQHVYMNHHFLLATATIDIEKLKQQTRFLRHDTVRVSGEQRSETHVGKTQPQHDDTLETDTTACMRRTSVAESVDVVAETIRVGVDGADVLLHTLA